jgi:hypothetical protein
MKPALSDQKPAPRTIRRSRQPSFKVSSMSTFKWLASITLAAAILPVLHAEPHCPGNVASLATVVQMGWNACLMSYHLRT